MNAQNNTLSMFTGIIQEIGTIKKITQDGDNKVVEIEAKTTLKDCKKGGSICVNGICSTVMNISDSEFSVEYMPETLKLTTVQDWQEKESVNLESSLTLSDKLSGHFVAGHVDAVGKIINIKENDFDISFPPEIAKFIAFKGSITVDGISLTVSKLDDEHFTVSIIPHTLENTTLGKKIVSDTINLEVDLISRYLQRFADLSN
ncbi:riboflavin synthase [Patescibacteria group bacterium]